MSTHVAQPTSGLDGANPSSSGRSQLLIGCAGGPLFTAVVIIQLLTRQGFDLSRQPLSLLSLGNLGWIQITNFILTGVMAVVGAMGAARALPPGRGSTWVPRLVGAYGAGLIVAGLCRPDPANGFPVGAPAGAPTHITWHNMLHGVGAGLAFTALVVAATVFARRMGIAGNRVMRACSIATAGAVVVTMACPLAAFSIRMFVSSVFAWAWVSLTCGYLARRGLSA